MSETTGTPETLETPKTEKPAKPTKAAAKKNPPAKPTKADKPTKKDAPAGPTAQERRKTLVKFLQKKAAVGAKASQPMSLVAEKTGLTRNDVYALVNGTSGSPGDNPRCLLATGHVKTMKVEGEVGLHVFLTPKGQKTKFDEAPFVA